MEKKKITIDFGRPLTFWDGLQLLFIGLKLAGAIDWRWFWVFAPTWIMILVIAVLSIVTATVSYSKQCKGEKRV